MNQQSYDGLEDEAREWRISAGWLIQIELGWLVATGFIGWHLGGLPPDTWLAQAYRVLAGGNVLGLFVLGNAAGYLLYEEIKMVLARIHQRETIAKAVNKARKEALEEGRQQGLEEGRQERQEAARQEGQEAAQQTMAAWYERQQAAQREGRPFDEPPPGYVNGDANGSSPAE